MERPMRKKFVQFVAFLLVLVTLPAVPASAAPGYDTEQLIKVGLYYGSTALPGANLQNYTGTGFRFGLMYDDTFVELGATSQTAISMVKTQNVYYTSQLPGGGYGYTDQLTTNLAVGCYHLQMSGSYNNFKDAQAAAYSVGGFPAWIDGSYYVRIGAYTSKNEAVAAAGGRSDLTPVGTSSYGITVVITGTNQPVFQFDGGADNAMLVVKPGLDDSEKTITHFKGYKYYGSFRYERINGGNLTVVNLVSMEDYADCVISREMNDSWPLEALKAQAVAVRSYAVTRTGHPSYHFDVCGSTHCQAYYGINATGANTARAAAETAGQYAWYNGQVIQAVYHSCDGGATENCENVWREALPYLRGVIDPYEALVADKISNYQWTKTYTGMELSERLNSISDSYSCGEIIDVRVTKVTDTGNVYSVALTDKYGKVINLTRDDVRTVMGVNSLRYSIAGSGEGYSLTDGQYLSSLNQAWALDGNGNRVQISGNSVYAITGNGIESVNTPGTSNNGTFVINGSGRGHNLGMSQWGAYAMATEGFTYREILQFYYTTGIEIY